MADKILVKFKDYKEYARKYKTFIIAAVVIALILALILGIPKQKIMSTTIANVGLKLVAENFVSPIDLKSPNDRTGRLFVVDRIGKIFIIMPDNQVLPEPFLDIQDKMVELSSRYDERGLLSMAFHPDFQNNGRFFVYYSAPLRANGPAGWDHTSRISEFKVDLKGSDKANAASEKVILEIDEPQMNHNGGQLAFGQDGYLYISSGDGGNANDVGLGHVQGGNAQDLSTLLGKIIRINVNTGTPYSIPSDNPFTRKQGLPEIFAYGFRNPWRMSFDKVNQELFVADVGQNLWEEIDIVERGKNYGWNKKEGAQCFDPKNPDNSPSQCDSAGLADPIIEYKNAGKGGIGVAVIGGFVYNGKAISELKGKYIFGDWSSSFTSGSGQLFIGEKINDKWEMKQLMELNEFLLGFGEDSENELYVLTSKSVGPGGSSGKVYKIISNS